MQKFRDKYRIPSARLRGWDYGSPGLYFVTICTKDRNHYFGEIVVESHGNATLQKTEIGLVAEDHWKKIPAHFPFVVLDEFVIMQDHIHGILLLNNPEHTIWQPNRFAPQSKNIPSIIRGYKASVTKFATMYQIPFAWQPRYFDRIIRTEKELNNIRRYIINNPAQWKEDSILPENLMI